VRLALIHNDDAGRGVYSTSDLSRIFRDVGYSVETFDKDDAEISRAIASRPDVLVVSGGDGTVARVAIALCGAEIPLFLLPNGTANNIARSIGADAAIPMLAGRLMTSRLERIDIGRIRGDGHEDNFVEAAGFGFIGNMLGEEHRPLLQLWRSLRSRTTRSVDRWARAARGVARLVRKQPLIHVSITADGEDLSGEYVAVEVLNIRAIGPRILLAPNANPLDGCLDLVLLPADARDAFADFVASRSGAAQCPPLFTRRVRRVEMDWPATDTHVDDSVWPSAAKTGRPTHVVIDVRGGAPVLVPD
jgi:diacylglycerol kinase family enzyme